MDSPHSTGNFNFGSSINDSQFLNPNNPNDIRISNRQSGSGNVVSSNINPTNNAYSVTIN